MFIIIHYQVENLPNTIEIQLLRENRKRRAEVCGLNP